MHTWEWEYVCLSHALQEAPIKHRLFLMTSKREASGRGKKTPRRVQKPRTLTAWTHYNSVSCVWLAQLVLPLTIIGLWVGMVRSPANQDTLGQSGCMSLTHLCCSSSSTDLRRLLLVKQVKSINERILQRQMKERNRLSPSETMEEILLSWSETELSAAQHRYMPKAHKYTVSTSSWCKY